LAKRAIKRYASILYAESTKRIKRYAPTLHAELARVKYDKLLQWHFTEYTKSKTPITLVMEDRTAGFFSNYFQVLGALDFCVRYRFNLVLNFSSGLYLDSESGSNWWEHYFETSQFHFSPIVAQSVCLVVNTTEQRNFAYHGRYLPLDRGFFLTTQVRIRRSILERVNQFAREHLDGRYVVGVHYRGTDKVNGLTSEAVRVPYADVVRYLTESCDPTTHFFVATDEQAFLDELQSKFGARTIHYNALRSRDGNPVHVLSAIHSRTKIGEDALVECLLLSKCRRLIRTDSNLSYACRFFNPTLPVITLSKGMRLATC
jgi:hypothetical protein